MAENSVILLKIYFNDNYHDIPSEAWYDEKNK